jgi:hypothetical protein
MAKQSKPFDPRRPNDGDVKFGAGRGSTITETNIVAAVVLEDRHQKRRIERIGELNRQTLKDLGAKIVRR